MAKIALSILIAALSTAQQSIKVDEIYAHYKDSSKHYQIVGLAINTQKEEEAEILVIYKALYLENPILWSRPVKNWLEMVEVAGEKVPRFTKIE